MGRSLINSTAGAAGWLRRGSLWTAVAALAVLASGGVALAGTATSSTTTAQIQACYQPGSNPSTLKVLHKAGSTCPTGDQTLTWNTTGPRGKRGPRGVQGPAGLSTGVSAGNLNHVLIDGGLNDPITVMTGPAVPTSGVYYVSGSLTIEVAQSDFVGCSFSPQASEPTNEEIGPATATQFESMSLNGEISLSAGQSPSITCIDANSDPTTQTGEGDLNAVLVNNSTVGTGSPTLRHEPNSPLKIKRP
jgi:hypothetical protein